MSAAGELVRLSKYAGGRYDLVQSGGGNTSVKQDGGGMLIKTSGCLLSEVEEDYGYVTVDHAKALAVLDHPDIALAADRASREAAYSRLVRQAVLGPGRPSIEMPLHALMGKYTLHTHPIPVAVAACRKDWEEVVAGLFPDAATVGYRTPGVELALLLKEALGRHAAEHDGRPKVVFLQNHGLIVSSGDLDEVIAASEEVSARLEEALGMDLSKYRMTTKLAALANPPGRHGLIAYLSCDETILGALETDRRLFLMPPFCPDMQVYCGPCALELEGLDDRTPFTLFKQRHSEPPRVVAYGGMVFLIARNVRKAREMEEALKFHVMVLEKAGAGACFLDPAETAYIRNWEAEKYRKDL